MGTKIVFPGPDGGAKIVDAPRVLAELVEYAAGIGHAVIIPDLPPKGFDRNKDVAAITEEFLKASAAASAALIRGDAGRKVGGPALQAAIYAYRLAQYAMVLEEERLVFAMSQSQ